MEGDTELGLVVKNALDALELPVFEPAQWAPSAVFARLQRLRPSLVRPMDPADPQGAAHRLFLLGLLQRRAAGQPRRRAAGPHRHVAEMSCIAGVGGDVPVADQDRAIGPRHRGALDGCPLECARHCLQRHGVNPTQHHQLNLYGVRKRLHEDFDPEQAEAVLFRVRSDLQKLPAGPHPMNPPPTETRRLLVAITGASGAVYGLRLLQALQTVSDVDNLHAVVSDAGWQTLRHELHADAAARCARWCTRCTTRTDIGAGPASGSFRCGGMVVAPCSMRTLAAIAHGLSDNLVTRAADVMLKERRRLVLMARETPLHLGHLRNMTAVTEMGAIVCPPVPAFYLRPQSVDDIVNASVARVLDLLDVAAHAEPALGGAGSRMPA